MYIQTLDTPAASQNSSRRLNCLIEGTTTVFEVIVKSDVSFSNLKNIIKNERAIDNPKDPHALRLWKVNVDLKPYENSFSGLANLTVNDKVGEKPPWDFISDWWPEQPPHHHLHIIVKIPRAVSTPSDHVGTSSPSAVAGEDNNREIKRIKSIIPTDSLLEIDAIEKDIKEELRSIQWVVEKFLENPELPPWVPPNHTQPNNYEFLTALKIPAYRNGNPSILFHNLHMCNVEEFTATFERVTCMCICNTSGSGKTRRMMEVLTQHWGFYLVAAPDDNGVGIEDLRDALQRLPSLHRDWVSDLRSVSPEKRATQSEMNSRIASRAFRKVLAARILVFEFFLYMAKQVDGNLIEKHKRIWLLFQSFSSLGVHGEGLHPFIRVNHRLRCASDKALDILIGRLGDVIDTYLPRSRIILVLDEAQGAIRQYPYSGISMATKASGFQSIVREMVKVFTEVQVKLIVSGTGVSLVDLEDAIASGASKHAHKVEVFHQLGMFDTWPKLKAFVEQYIPPSILESPSGDSLQLRMQEFLLGRYRLSVSFLEYLLMNGLQSPHKLLNRYLEVLINRHPGETGVDFTSCEPNLHFDVQPRGFEWDKLKNDSPAIQEAFRVVQSHLVKGRTPEYGPVTANLVEYGIAYLREGHKGHIIEALPFLSVMIWLQSQPNANLYANLRIQSGDTNTRAYAFEEIFVLYLLQTLRNPVRLNSIFDFHDKHTPSWAKERAQIVAVQNGIHLHVDVIGDAPQNPGLGIVEYAENIEDVISWIEAHNSAPAILIPGISFGPDVLLRVALPSKTTVKPNIVILMGQFKSYISGNKDTLDAKTVSKALKSLKQTHWFKKSPTTKHQQLLKLLENYKILRFVAGYPLHADLRQQGAAMAVDEFPKGDALATIFRDPFVQHFQLHGNLLNVLAPMEETLARKRLKAS